MQKLCRLGLTWVFSMGLIACGGGGSGGGKNTAPSSSTFENSSSVAVSSKEQNSSLANESSQSSSTEISSSSSALPLSSEASSISSSIQTSSVKSSVSSSSSDEGVSLTGIFVDSAVAGIGYRTETKQGFTNEKGEYAYLEGETVTFFIGNLELPAVAAKRVITPLDIANNTDLNNRIALNIAILLQSLDSDKNPSNGISIDYETLKMAANPVNFDQPTSSFSTAIAYLVNLVGNTITTEQAAKEHVQNTLDSLKKKSLISVWYLDSNAYNIIVAFLDETRYIGIDNTDLELGTYEWNVTTGYITAQIQTDINLLGFSTGRYRIHGTGDQFLMSEDGQDQNVPMIKLAFDSENFLKSGWLSQENELGILLAFNGEQYFIGRYNYTSEGGANALDVQSGSYIFNADKKEFHLNVSNIEGFSSPCTVSSVKNVNTLSCGTVVFNEVGN